MAINYFKELKIKIGILPTDFKWLFWFSVLLFFPCMLFLLFAREQLYELIIPYTGWSPGIVYFCILTMLTAVPKTFIKTDANSLVSLLNIRYRTIFILGIYLIFGIFDWFESAPEYYIHKNPYLRYDPLRPIFAILVPTFWIIIIGVPLAKYFCRKNLKVSIK